MALIFCPECGTQVSEHAEACGKCSYPISRIKGNSMNTNNNNNQNFNTSNNEVDMKLIVAGYVAAFISLLFYPIIFAPVGIIIGIITITKGNTGHGVAHIALSVVLGILGFILGVLSYAF
jgi:ribosomal protein L40E